jgi:wobble nucleotide-excising tRNase
MGLVPSASEGTDHEVCPFCAQDLDGSSVMEAYRTYFSESYADLKASIDRGIAGLARSHGNDAPAAFERAVRVAIQRRDFWKDFVEVPELNIDTAAIARTWNKAREIVLTALNAKKAAPLDAVTLTSADLLALDEYETATSGIVTISDALLAVNPKIALVKEQVASANVTALAADLAKLKATEARHSSATNLLCQAYMDEKVAKKITEGIRDTAREALDVYRTAIFPAYETAINAYLVKFNAGFRLGSVTSVNNRSGSSCSYNVLERVNTTSISVI